MSAQQNQDQSEDFMEVTPPAALQAEEDGWQLLVSPTCVGVPAASTPNPGPAEDVAMEPAEDKKMETCADNNPVHDAQHDDEKKASGSAASLQAASSAMHAQGKVQVHGDRLGRNTTVVAHVILPTDVAVSVAAFGCKRLFNRLTIDVKGKLIPVCKVHVETLDRLYDKEAVLELRPDVVDNVLQVRGQSISNHWTSKPFTSVADVPKFAADLVAVSPTETLVKIRFTADLKIQKWSKLEWFTNALEEDLTALVHKLHDEPVRRALQKQVDASSALTFINSHMIDYFKRKQSQLQ